MNDKIPGYVLISVGLIVILAASFSTYLVFTGGQTPYKLLEIPAISFDFDPKNMLSSELPPELITDANTKQSVELASSEVLTDSANIGFHLLLMTFLLNAGFKVASIGVNLVKTVVVKASSSS